jgi:hypothetical protein
LRGSDPSNGGQITARHTWVAPTSDSFSRNARASIGAVEAGNGTRDGKRGTRSLSGHTMSFSRHLDAAGRKVNGVHVETHLVTDVGKGSRNTLEVSGTNRSR